MCEWLKWNRLTSCFEYVSARSLTHLRSSFKFDWKIAKQKFCMASRHLNDFSSTSINVTPKLSNHLLQMAWSGGGGGGGVAKNMPENDEFKQLNCELRRTILQRTKNERTFEFFFSLLWETLGFWHRTSSRSSWLFSRNNPIKKYFHQFIFSTKAIMLCNYIRCINEWDEWAFVS